MANQDFSRIRGTKSHGQSESEQRETSTLWSILNDLTLARKQYNLLPQTLMVLRALMSFLPKDGASTLVWPSNTTLAERSAGLSERSLRRHIDRLIEAGLIQRKSSSNGKRFALRYQHNVVEAFGFDLAGLLQSAPDIKSAAQDEADRQSRIKTLKGLIRQKLYQLGDKAEAFMFNILRHKDNLEELQQLHQVLSEDHSPIKTPELTATDRQFDRHIQNTNKESICKSATKKQSPNEDHPHFEECLEAIKDSIPFASQPLRSWPDIIRFGYEMAPMIGLSKTQMEHAQHDMGPIPAALSVICISQKLGQVERPAAYFQGLLQKARQGQFSLKGLMRSSSGFKRLQLQC